MKTLYAPVHQKDLTYLQLTGMKQLVTTLLLTFSSILVYSQEEPKEEFKHKEMVAEFIQLVRKGRVEQLAGRTSFPLGRQYPLPLVKDKQDLIRRYNEIFDDSLTKMILSSDPAADWAQVGWRGIMLHNGVLWLDEEGGLVAVNYHSPAELKKRQELIAADRQKLHTSVQSFEDPVYVLETQRYRIRIDDMGDGNYRYASWPIRRGMNEPPELVILNGKREYYGSGGNHGFEFVNQGIKYLCDITVMGSEEEPPARLTVSQGDKELFTLPAQIIRD